MSLKHNWNTGETIKPKRESFNHVEILRLLKQHELGNLKIHHYKELADRVSLYFNNGEVLR